MLPWQPNKIVTDHKTHKLGRQSSNDHNCQIWFTLLQWLWRKMQFNQMQFSYKSAGVFCCHGKKKQKQKKQKKTKKNKKKQTDRLADF